MESFNRMDLSDIVRKSLYWGVIMATMDLCGCTTHPLPKAIVPLCLPQYQYTNDTMEALAKEVEDYSEKVPVMTLMLGNYSDLRAQNAICIKKQGDYFSKMGDQVPNIVTLKTK